MLAVQWVLFDGKMRALFSMMFGAGIVLFMERALARENSVRPADLLTRRMLWLMLFGALHGWLIWRRHLLFLWIVRTGDRADAQRRTAQVADHRWCGADAAVVGRRGSGFRSAFHARRGGGGARRRGAGQTLTMEQRDAKEEWDEEYNMALPSKEKLQEEVDDYRKGYGGVMMQRAPVMRKFNFVPVYFPPGIDIWALMLIGMALFKLGVLQGERPRSFYVRLAVAGYAIGIPVNALSTYGMMTSNYDIIATMFWNSPYQIGRVAVALGHASV